MAPEAFFLPVANAQNSQRFCLFHPAQGGVRGGLLYLHPFAEEMNKARRMAALQARLLAENGFTNVYQVTDGREGDAVENPDSPVKGQRVLNGWKNSGAPWTYEPDLERIKLTKGEELSIDKK